MSVLAIVLLSILAVIVIAGIIRVMVKPSDSFVDLFIDILWLDCLLDILGVIFSGIGECLSDIDLDL